MVKNIVGGNRLFSEQLYKRQTLVLNLLRVTDPFENLMKARKTCVHRIFAYDFRKLLNSLKLNQSYKFRSNCEPHGAGIVF